MKSSANKKYSHGFSFSSLIKKYALDAFVESPHLDTAATWIDPGGLTRD